MGRKADSFNAVFAGATSTDGLAFLNGPVALGSSITGIDISDVKDLQTALGAKAIQSTTYTKTEADDLLSAKAPLASPTFNGTVNGITKSMVGLGNVDNTSDANKPYQMRRIMPWTQRLTKRLHIQRATLIKRFLT